MCPDFSLDLKLWDRRVLPLSVRALLDGTQEWNAELLEPVAGKSSGSTRKNNSGHGLYFIEKYEIQWQLSQSLLEVRHFELWTYDIQLLVRKHIIITFERIWCSANFTKRMMVRWVAHFIYGRNVVCHKCSISTCFQKKFHAACNHTSSLKNK